MIEVVPHARVTDHSSFRVQHVAGADAALLLLSRRVLAGYAQVLHGLSFYAAWVSLVLMYWEVSNLGSGSQP